jgi:hypothetical protein
MIERGSLDRLNNTYVNLRKQLLIFGALLSSQGLHFSSTFGFKCPMGLSKKPNTPKMKFGMERSSKMKVVCTWGFSLIVDIGEVIGHKFRGFSGLNT